MVHSVAATLMSYNRDVGGTMKISKILVAAFLCTAVGASAQGTGDLPPGQKAEADAKVTPPATPAITLSGVTGTVQIKTAGGIMTVKAGEPVPVIPSGAEIIVVSGDVTVAVGGSTIKAGAGDSFTVSTNGSAVSVAVTGGLVSVAGPDGKAKDVAKGEGVTVSAAATPAAKPVVVAGKTEDKPADQNPDSIPADSSGDSTVSGPPATSPTQESANTTTTTCPPVTSTSAPCP